MGYRSDIDNKANIADVQPLDPQLTSLATLVPIGNALKVVRVKADQTGFELATPSSGGGGGSGYSYFPAGWG
jgi:hypothetical protein